MMLIAAELPKGAGMVVFLPATIGGCITNLSNKQETTVYTDTFPDGVTIAMPVKEFCEAWQTALFYEEFEIEFNPEALPEVQH